jgi:hypothetical protein
MAVFIERFRRNVRAIRPGYRSSINVHAPKHFAIIPKGLKNRPVPVWLEVNLRFQTVGKFKMDSKAFEHVHSSHSDYYRTFILSLRHIYCSLLC